MHRFNKSVWVIFFILVLSNFVFIFDCQHVKADSKEIWVDYKQRYPDDADGTLGNPYKHIQNAIDAASAGDIIKVLPGVYSEDLVVDKSVTITNDNRTYTIIQSSEQVAYMIDIVVSSVSLEGFTINDTTSTSHRKAVVHISSNAKDVRIIGNMINHSSNGYGIFVEGNYNDSKVVINNNTINDTRGIKITNSNSNSIYGNTIKNCTGYPAIHLSSSSGTNIENNVLDRCLYGLNAENSQGLVIKSNKIYWNTNSGVVINSGSDNANFDNNTIYNNGNYGIDLKGSNSVVNNSNIYKNIVGITLDTSYCNITNCSINNCSLYGIYAKSGSRKNYIYNNTLNNSLGAYHAHEEGSNYWDNGVFGNYWDDFYGPDPNSLNTTVTDENVFKYTKGGVQDNYPKGIFQKPPEIFNPQPSNLATGVSKSPRLSANVTDPDPSPYKERLDVYFYYVVNGTTNLIGLIGIDRNVESGKEASVWFSSTISGKNAVYSYAGLGYDYIGVWYIEVYDSYSKSVSPQWIFSTLETPINNAKPTARIGASQEFMQGTQIKARIGDKITFDASASNDSDGTIVFYRFSFGDGTNEINNVRPVHSYSSKGSYTVNLVVIDNDGASNSINMPVVIEERYNLPPEAEIAAPTSVNVGDIIYFNSDRSSDPDQGDVITYYWRFGDGKYSNESDPIHSYSAAGVYTINLTVTDDNGSRGFDEQVITVESTISDESPGFELILVFAAILFIFVRKRKIKK